MVSPSRKLSLSLSLSRSFSALKSTSYSVLVHLTRDISSTIGEANEDMSRPSSLCLLCLSSVHVGDYFGTITLSRGLSDTDGATIARQTLRGGNGDPESFPGRPVPWQRTYDLHRSDIPLEKVKHEREEDMSRAREWHEKRGKKKKIIIGKKRRESTADFSRCLTASSYCTCVSQITLARNVLLVFFFSAAIRFTEANSVPLLRSTNLIFRFIFFCWIIIIFA